MKYLKFFLSIYILFFMKLALLYSQAKIDSSNIGYFFSYETVNRQYSLENTYFTFKIKAFDYKEDTVIVNLSLRNKSKEACYINHSLQKESNDQDTIPYFTNCPFVPEVHSDRVNYKLYLLDSEQEFNCTIKLDSKLVNKITLEIGFIYGIDKLLHKFPNDIIKDKKIIYLHYPFIQSNYEGIQKISISTFDIKKEGKVLIYFTGMN